MRRRPGPILISSKKKTPEALPTPLWRLRRALHSQIPSVTHQSAVMLETRFRLLIKKPQVAGNDGTHGTFIATIHSRDRYICDQLRSRPGTKPERYAGTPLAYPSATDLRQGSTLGGYPAIAGFPGIRAPQSTEIRGASRAHGTLYPEYRQEYPRLCSGDGMRGNCTHRAPGSGRSACNPRSEAVARRKMRSHLHHFTPGTQFSLLAALMALAQAEQSINISAFFAFGEDEFYLTEPDTRRTIISC